VAVPELPDSIVILGTGLSDPEPGAPPADPVKDVEARFLTEPGKAAVDAPQQAYVGDGALDAAKGPASEPRPEVLTLPLSFDLDNERVNVVVTPESFSEVLIGLYIAGEWKWVQSFLHAVGASLLRANVVGRGNQLYRQPKADPADSARLRAFGDAAQTAIGALNDHIASALVALALQVTDKAQELPHLSRSRSGSTASRSGHPRRIRARGAPKAAVEATPRQMRRRPRTRRRTMNQLNPR
jgi:hypothetical protein